MKFFDNTRIHAYRLCPRFFYYRHVRHWAPTGFNAALSAGGAWHEGMDIVWSAPDEPLIASAAADVWENYMKKEGIDVTDPVYGLTEFRTKGVFKEMFKNYVQVRRDFFNEIKLLHVEKPFAVPIRESADIFYVGRLDKVFERKDRILISEHKTTSMYAKQGNFRITWVNSFSPNSQIDGYSYAGHLLYPDQFKAVWVDAALVHKTVHDAFKWIPLERRMDGLELWLWETNDWIEKIQNDLGTLKAFRQDQAIAEISNDFMPCFPRSDPTACVQYNKECVYKDLCAVWSNPEEYDTPKGFIEKRWEPFDELKLETLGLEKEE